MPLTLECLTCGGGPYYLVSGKRGGQPFWPLGAQRMDRQIRILPEHLAVEEERCAEGMVSTLVLCGGGDPLLHSQIRQ